MGRRSGSRAAAYNAHGPELYRFALRSLGDDGAAQDAVQETFLRAWRSSSRFDPELASLRVWLFAIARNTVVDSIRRDSARPWQRELSAAPELLADVPPAVDGLDEVMMAGWIVEEALRQLSPEHRDAIVETYLRERPYAEVAAERGVPVGTLRSRVFYGLKALRLAMDEMGVEP